LLIEVESVRGIAFLVALYRITSTSTNTSYVLKVGKFGNFVLIVGDVVSESPIDIFFIISSLKYIYPLFSV